VGCCRSQSLVNICTLETTAAKDESRAAHYQRTVAAQQTRTSYLCPSLKPCSKYHDSRPWGASSVGNATDSALCTEAVAEDEEGTRVSSFRSAKRGSASGNVMGAGATKMVFSVFARAAVTSSANSAVQRAGDLIVLRSGKERKHVSRVSNSCHSCLHGMKWRYRVSLRTLCLRRCTAMLLSVVYLHARSGEGVPGRLACADWRRLIPRASTNRAPVPSLFPTTLN
jgi:hypothetical protein